jgi:hypothetical protein
VSIPTVTAMAVAADFHCTFLTPAQARDDTAYAVTPYAILLFGLIITQKQSGCQVYIFCFFKKRIFL